MRIALTISVMSICAQAFGTSNHKRKVADVSATKPRIDSIDVARIHQNESRRTLLSSFSGFATATLFTPTVDAMISQPKRESIKLGLKKETCMKDCMKECALIAPKDTAYCTEQCQSFCNQLEESDETK